MLKQLTTSGLIVLVTFATAVTANEDQTPPPIKQLTGLRPAASVFKATTRGKPLVIKSEKDAAQHFTGDGLAKLKKQVDFTQQYVLVFAWRGSGQDRLGFDRRLSDRGVDEIVFHLKPGRTRDLRSHTSVYVLRSNVKWLVK